MPARRPPARTRPWNECRGESGAARWCPSLLLLPRLHARRPGCGKGARRETLWGKSTCSRRWYLPAGTPLRDRAADSRRRPPAAAVIWKSAVNPWSALPRLDATCTILQPCECAAQIVQKGGYERITLRFGNGRSLSNLRPVIYAFRFVQRSRPILAVRELSARDVLEAAAVDGNHRSRDVFAGIAGQPHDQARDRGRLHPLRPIGARHVLAIGGRVHRAREDYVCGDAGIFVLGRNRPDQRYQRGLRCAVSTHARSGVFRGPAADGDDAPRTGLAHERDDRAQNVESAVEIHIKHTLERGVVRFGDGCAAGEPANQMRENVDPSEAGEDRASCLLRRVETVDCDGKRSEIRVIEVGLLDLRREPDHGEAGVQQGSCNVGSEAAMGSGDESNWFGHSVSLQGPSS